MALYTGRPAQPTPEPTRRQIARQRLARIIAAQRAERFDFFDSEWRS